MHHGHASVINRSVDCLFVLGRVFVWKTSYLYITKAYTHLHVHMDVQRFVISVIHADSTHRHCKWYDVDFIRQVFT